MSGSYSCFVEINSEHIFHNCSISDSFLPSWKQSQTLHAGEQKSDDVAGRGIAEGQRKIYIGFY